MKKPYIAILSALESILREARMWKSLWAFLGACGGGELERWEARSSWMKERVPVYIVCVCVSCQNESESERLIRLELGSKVNGNEPAVIAFVRRGWRESWER